MAEMTASEAIELLKRQWEHLFSLNQDQIDGLMKFIEQQQQTIEAMKCCENCRHNYSDFGDEMPCGDCCFVRVNVNGNKWELWGK